jgi:phospholipid/cholesterol/gamma-HCH transport system substrate-binding protein
MLNRKLLDLWVGVFVAIGLVSILFLATKVGNMTGASLGKVYEVEAPFDNIGGLKPRAAVRSAGVLVGRVSEIRFDAEIYRAVVLLQIDERYPFPQDTTASILTSGLLGEQYIGLDAGGDEAMLRSGDTLRLTQSAVVLEKLIGQFLFDKASAPNPNP